jgi:hypothetical protein
MIMQTHNRDSCELLQCVYQLLSESSQTVTVVTASVKEDERGGQGHTSASVCHMTLRCEQTLFLHERFFDFVFNFVCDGWQNRTMRLHQVLPEAR